MGIHGIAGALRLGGGDPILVKRKHARQKPRRRRATQPSALVRSHDVFLPASRRGFFDPLQK